MKISKSSLLYKIFRFAAEGWEREPSVCRFWVIVFRAPLLGLLLILLAPIFLPVIWWEKLSEKISHARLYDCPFGKIEFEEESDAVKPKER